MTADEPLKLGSHFDANGHDLPDSPEDTAVAVAELLELAGSRQIPAAERADALSLAGVYLRRLLRLDEAAAGLEEALRVFHKEGQKRKALVDSIWLGHVYQWQGRFAEADGLFRQAIDVCGRDPELAGYIDFAYQHYGRSLVDQTRYREAITAFERALQIRVAKGDEELIESTRGALELAQSRFRETMQQA